METTPHEKISPVPSYEQGMSKDDGKVEVIDVKYGTGVEEKDLGLGTPSTSEEGKTEAPASKPRQIFRKYRIFFVLALETVATGWVHSIRAFDNNHSLYFTDGGSLVLSFIATTMDG